MCQDANHIPLSQNGNKQQDLVTTARELKLLHTKTGIISSQHFEIQIKNPQKYIL
jgi:hypothetical protein